jgi:hypothetical protein
MYKLPPNIVKTFASTFKKEKPKISSTVYGYAVINEGQIYVKLDGSTEYTPVVSTIDVVDGDRVIVNITNHRAIIVNNISSPAARSNSVTEIKSELSDMTDVHKTTFAFKSLNNVTLESFYDYMIKKGFITRYVKMSDETEEASAVVLFNLSSGAAISGSNILNNSITSDKLAESAATEIISKIPDTGFVALTLQSSFENYNDSSKLSYREINNSMVYLDGVVKRAKGLTSSQILTIIPKNVAPRHDMEFIFPCDNDRMCYATLSTIGILTITSVYDQDGTKSTEPLNRVYINTSYTVLRG